MKSISVWVLLITCFILLLTVNNADIVLDPFVNNDLNNIEQVENNNKIETPTIKALPVQQQKIYIPQTTSELNDPRISIEWEVQASVKNVLGEWEIWQLPFKQNPRCELELNKSSRHPLKWRNCNITLVNSTSWKDQNIIGNSWVQVKNLNPKEIQNVEIVLAMYSPGGWDRLVIDDKVGKELLNPNVDIKVGTNNDGSLLIYHSTRNESNNSAPTNPLVFSNKHTGGITIDMINNYPYPLGPYLSKAAAVSWEFTFDIVKNQVKSYVLDFPKDILQRHCIFNRTYPETVSDEYEYSLNCSKTTEGLLESNFTIHKNKWVTVHIPIELYGSDTVTNGILANVAIRLSAQLTGLETHDNIIIDEKYDKIIWNNTQLTQIDSDAGRFKVTINDIGKNTTRILGSNRYPTGNYTTRAKNVKWQILLPEGNDNDITQRLDFPSLQSASCVLKTAGTVPYWDGCYDYPISQNYPATFKNNWISTSVTNSSVWLYISLAADFGVGWDRLFIETMEITNDNFSEYAILDPDTNIVWKALKGDSLGSINIDSSYPRGEYLKHVKKIEWELDIIVYKYGITDEKVAVIEKQVESRVVLDLENLCILNVDENTYQVTCQWANRFRSSGWYLYDMQPLLALPNTQGVEFNRTLKLWFEDTKPTLIQLGDTVLQNAARIEYENGKFKATFYTCDVYIPKQKSPIVFKDGIVMPINRYLCTNYPYPRGDYLAKANKVNWEVHFTSNNKITILAFPDPTQTHCKLGHIDNTTTWELQNCQGIPGPKQGLHVYNRWMSVTSPHNLSNEIKQVEFKLAVNTGGDFWDRLNIDYSLGEYLASPNIEIKVKHGYLHISYTNPDKPVLIFGNNIFQPIKADFFNYEAYPFPVSAYLNSPSGLKDLKWQLQIGINFEILNNSNNINNNNQQIFDVFQFYKLDIPADETDCTLDINYDDIDNNNDNNFDISQYQPQLVNCQIINNNNNDNDINGINDDIIANDWVRIKIPHSNNTITNINTNTNIRYLITDKNIVLSAKTGPAKSHVDSIVLNFNDDFKAQLNTNPKNNSIDITSNRFKLVRNNTAIIPLSNSTMYPLGSYFNQVYKIKWQVTIYDGNKKWSIDWPQDSTKPYCILSVIDRQWVECYYDAFNTIPETNVFTNGWVTVKLITSPSSLFNNINTNVIFTLKTLPHGGKSWESLQIDNTIGQYLNDQTSIIQNENGKFNITIKPNNINNNSNSNGKDLIFRYGGVYPLTNQFINDFPYPPGNYLANAIKVQWEFHATIILPQRKRPNSNRGQQDLLEPLEIKIQRIAFPTDNLMNRNCHLIFNTKTYITRWGKCIGYNDQHLYIANTTVYTYISPWGKVVLEMEDPYKSQRLNTQNTTIEYPRIVLAAQFPKDGDYNNVIWDGFMIDENLNQLLLQPTTQINFVNNHGFQISYYNSTYNQQYALGGNYSDIYPSFNTINNIFNGKYPVEYTYNTNNLFWKLYIPIVPTTDTSPEIIKLTWPSRWQRYCEIYINVNIVDWGKCSHEPFNNNNSEDGYTIISPNINNTNNSNNGIPWVQVKVLSNQIQIDQRQKPHEQLSIHLTYEIDNVVIWDKKMTEV